MSESPYVPTGYCPACGYRADPGICSECGLLITEGNLVRGLRRRRWLNRRLVVWGLVTLTVVAGCCYWAPRINWVSYMPSWGLLLLSSWNHHPAGEELFSRLQADRLSPSQIEALLRSELAYDGRLYLREPWPAGAPVKIALGTQYPGIAFGGTFELIDIVFLETYVDDRRVDSPEFWGMVCGLGECEWYAEFEPMSAGSHEISMRFAFTYRVEQDAVSTVHLTGSGVIKVGDITLESFVESTTCADWQREFVCDNLRCSVTRNEDESGECTVSLCRPPYSRALAGRLRFRAGTGEPWQEQEIVLPKETTSTVHSWTVPCASPDHAGGAQWDIAFLPSHRIAESAGLKMYLWQSIEWQAVPEVLRETQSTEDWCLQAFEPEFASCAASP